MSATTGEPRKEHVPHAMHNPPPPLSDFLYRFGAVINDDLLTEYTERVVTAYRARREARTTGRR